MTPRQAAHALASLFAVAILTAAAIALRAPHADTSPADGGSLPAQGRSPERDGGPGGCAEGLAETASAKGVPGTLSEARSLLRTRDRVVTADNETTLTVVALASALGKKIVLADVLDYEEHVTEVCVFERVSELDADTVIGALALGGGYNSRQLRQLIPDARTVIRFETEIRQEVTLDASVALAALAAHGGNLDVALEDVLTVRQTSRTERAFESTTNLDRDDALLALALTGNRPKPHN